MFKYNAIRSEVTIVFFFNLVFSFQGYVRLWRKELIYIHLLILGLWVGWPGLDLDEMKDECVPESDPGDKSPSAGLK